MPAAQPETKAPCAPLYTPERRNRLIYRVTYFGARINLEMFHAITDGNGGLLYLKSIVRNYLALRHPGELDSVPSPNSASAGDLAQDSFRNFYGGTRRRKAEKKTKVYRLHGFLPYDQLQFFEGHLSARQVLDRSHALGVSMTSYLGACFMLAIYHDMPALERSKPISISLPVNLRNYYPSETARNFFNSVYVTHTLTEADTLETVAPVFDAKLKEVLRPENIRAQMDEYEKLEHVPAIRPVPLFLKNATVKLFTKLEDRHVTAVVSNMGRITIPAELQPISAALRRSPVAKRFLRSSAPTGMTLCWARPRRCAAQRSCSGSTAALPRTAGCHPLRHGGGKMNTCPHCHIKVGGDSTYCPLCQNRLPGPAGGSLFPGDCAAHPPRLAPV